MKFPKMDFRFSSARPMASFCVRGGLGGLVDEDSAILWMGLWD